MKRSIFLFVVLLLSMLSPAFAQRERPHHHPHNPDPTVHNPVVIKDDGIGARVNFGLAFAPTFDWMYTQTEGYARDGVLVGMRYGIPLNINMTNKKFYYVSTGVFIEQLGSKLMFRDKVVLPGVGETQSTEIHRTYRTSYLTIPLGVTLKSRSLRNFFVCGNAGLYNSLLLKAYHIDGCMLEDELWSRERQQYTDASTFKFAGYAGLGFEYSVTPSMRAGVMVNYVHSFTNYFKGNGQAFNDVLNVDPKAQLGYFELELHINFF